MIVLFGHQSIVLHEMLALKTYHQHHLLGLFIGYQQSHSLFNLHGQCVASQHLYSRTRAIYISWFSYSLTKSFENYCVHTLHIAYQNLQV